MRVLKRESWGFFLACLDFKVHIFTAFSAIQCAYVLLKQQEPEIGIQ